jgi:crotonobetainyl-CoA:carnitine CoA-transferase CaiB-like acyl-CoA transferase
LERIKHQDDLIEIFTPIFKSETRDAWCAKLLRAEVPHSPAYDSNEALEDPQARHLQIKVHAKHPEMGEFTTVRPPYSFDDTPTLDVRPPPTLDEHGAEIRAELARKKAG